MQKYNWHKAIHTVDAWSSLLYYTIIQSYQQGIGGGDSIAITVLIADDHAVMRDGLRLLMETQEDIQVVGDVANGREAVRQTLQHRPDIVIMDIAMPELNGIEATRQIREASAATRVIILSMHATNEYIFEALQAGARGYLLKESAGGEVIKAVRAV
jgi:DNA-binding NarL/FixJ family response regulator